MLYFRGQHSKTLCNTSGTNKALNSNETGLINLHFFCAITFLPAVFFLNICILSTQNSDELKVGRRALFTLKC